MFLLIRDDSVSGELILWMKDMILCVVNYKRSSEWEMILWTGDDFLGEREVIL